MQLIGMLDSPYVRRVAVALDLLGVAFEHRPVSVFSTYERFRAINPVVKAPTLVCDDGGILMDSSLILQYVESTLPAPSPLWSADAAARLLQYRRLGFALAACEKSVQLVYETQLRPAERQHEPWKERVCAQLRAAFGSLENLQPATPPGAAPIDHAVIATAITWQFASAQIPALVPERDHPRLAALSRHCEAQAVFRRYPPDGPGVPGLGN